MADTKNKTPENNVKTLNFTKEELEFLIVRQGTLNRTATINADTKAVMDSFIINQVLPRLNIDPNKYDITYDLNKGILNFVNKIILPDNGQPTPIVQPK